MNLAFAKDLLKGIHGTDPPGCCGTFLEHPFEPLRTQECVDIGFVIEHRFAFYYWIRCKRRLMANRGSGEGISDEAFRPPDLITWDWHDDVGGECDFDPDQLKRLNQADDEEVALFCWAGLRSLNDGHVAPAAWLNAVGNVYVLQKQWDDDDDQNTVMEDRYGRPHHVYYFRSPEELAETFQETRSRTGVIWDVDMDYFTEQETTEREDPPRLTGEQIRSLLSPGREWMPQILGDLKAVTIALEPEYTGGLTRSLELYRAWEAALFDGHVFGKGCRWKAGLFEE